MAPRHSFWIIVSGNTPTSFRARRSEDLLPTLRQLQRTQPDTVLKWFERGRLWESPEAALEQQHTRRHAAAGRNREWRPGGDHKDPRARFKVPRDVKRARFKERQWDAREPGKRHAKPGPWPKAPGPGEPKRWPEPRAHETKPPAPSDQNAPKVPAPVGPPELRRGPGKPLGGWAPDVRPQGPGHRPNRPGGGRPPFKNRPPRPWSKGGSTPRDDRGRGDNRGHPDNRGRADSRGRPDNRGRSEGGPDDRGRPENRGRSNDRNRSKNFGRPEDRRGGGRRFGRKPRKPGGS